MDLSTTYLGFTLKNPFMIGSSPLGNSTDKVKELEDAGASALVMHSLFEEQIIHENEVAGFRDYRYGELLDEKQEVFPSAKDFPLTSEAYLNRIQTLKKETDLPVFASLNGISEGVWIEYARMIEEAGADALELNLYTLPTDNDDDSRHIEKRLVEIVDVTRNSVSIPLAVKISSRYTSICNFAQHLEYAGANGLVVFNQLFQADIDIKRRKLVHRLLESSDYNLLERLRWINILHSRLKMNIAITGGVKTGADAFKAILCGADAIQLVCSVLNKSGKNFSRIISEFTEICESENLENLDSIRGSLDHLIEPDPEAIERSNYLRILQGWTPESV
jgi:dihydroorotate dehydrogenase (fumarate)